VNEAGTQALLRAAEQAGVRRLVHVSSLAAREPQLSPYAASKQAGEAAVTVSPIAGRAIIIRPPAVYGPGDKATLPLLKALTQRVSVFPSTPASRFSLIHVHDLAAILMEAVTSSLSGMIEISDGRPAGYGWPDILAAAEQVTGIKVKALFLPRALPALVGGIAETAAAWRGVPNIVSRGKIAELYHQDWVAHGEGWPLPRPIGFAEGFASTLAWYRAAGWLPPGRGTVRSSPDTAPRDF
jgi:nucleoside-diphosphate-sugar epimerase